MTIAFPKPAELDGIAAAQAAERSAVRSQLVQTLANHVAEKAPLEIRNAPKAGKWSVRLLSLTNQYAPIGELGKPWIDDGGDHRWLWTEGRAALEEKVRAAVPEDYAVELSWDESGYPVQRYCYARLTVAAEQQSGVADTASAVEQSRVPNKYV